MRRTAIATTITQKEVGRGGGGMRRKICFKVTLERASQLRREGKRMHTSREPVVLLILAHSNLPHHFKLSMVCLNSKTASILLIHSCSGHQRQALRICKELLTKFMNGDHKMIQCSHNEAVSKGGLFHTSQILLKTAQ